MANAEFDQYYQDQQYGIAALGFENTSAAYTGANTHGWQGHATAEGVAVQGNILTSPEVVQAALSAFQKNDSLSLAERLLVALEAGSDAGGDRRCGEQDALSSYLVVAKPDDRPDNPSVKLIVPGQQPGGANPVQVLRRRFDHWHEAQSDASAGPSVIGIGVRANAYSTATRLRSQRLAVGMLRCRPSLVIGHPNS